MTRGTTLGFKPAQRTERVRVASPYGHGIDRVDRVVDTLAVMTKRRQLTEPQYHAGLRYRSCYEIIYGQLGGASDFDRARGRGLPGSPPPLTYMQASETVSLVKQVLYPRDYAVVHRVCVEGLTIEECAERLFGSTDRAAREEAGRHLREGLRELAERWYPEKHNAKIRAFRTDKPSAGDAQSVEPGKVHHAGT